MIILLLFKNVLLNASKYTMLHVYYIMHNIQYTYLSEKYVSMPKSLFNLFYLLRVMNSEQMKCILFIIINFTF